MDGWNTTSFWEGLFSEAKLVLGSVHVPVTTATSTPVSNKKNLGQTVEKKRRVT